MKILYLIDDFPPDKMTSSGILTLNLAKNMAKKGHRVFVITVVQDRKLVGVIEDEEIKVYKIYSTYHPRWRAYLSLYNYQVVKKVRKIVREIKPDVCHFQHIHSYISYYCFKIAKKSGAATFLTAHDVMLFHYGKLIEFINQKDLSIPKKFNYRVRAGQLRKRFKLRYNPLRNLIIRHYLKYIDKILVVSEALQKALSNNGISNTIVVYNGLEMEKWHISPAEVKIFCEKFNLQNKKIIFFGGRLSALKGGEKIVLALEKIAKAVPEATLMVAGRMGDYDQEMLALAQELKMADKIVFTGWLDGNELKAAYAVCHLVVVPSLAFDPFPTINLEAMAMKKPVVATCFGGSREAVIDNQTGYIVNPFNLEQLADRVADLLNNSNKAEWFGLAGYERVKTFFSLSKQTAETLNQYQEFVHCRE